MRSLTSRERATLEQIARAGRERADRVLRAKILLAVADGARFTTAARLVGRRSGDAVARLVARWNDEGLSALEPLYVRTNPAATAVVANGPKAEMPAATRPRRHSAPQIESDLASSLTPTDHDQGTSPAPNGLSRGAEIERVMRQALELDGALGVALVDLASGMTLGKVEQLGGSGFDLDVAAAGNTEVVRAKLATLRELGQREGIEDILITLSTQYHLIRPLGSDPTVFLYLVLGKSDGRLALARRGLSQLEAGFVV